MAGLGKARRRGEGRRKRRLRRLKGDRGGEREREVELGRKRVVFVFVSWRRRCLGIFSSCGWMGGRERERESGGLEGRKGRDGQVWMRGGRSGNGRVYLSLSLSLCLLLRS